jgi:hypothetical protein
MMPRLQALVNRMAELCQTGLRACHYAEEFILQRIQTLGHWERAARQVADQTLQASQETNAPMNWDLQSAQASITGTREKLSSKAAALDEMVIRERETQIKLQILGDEKKVQEQMLESTQKVLSKRDFSSSVVISSAVAHAVALMKNHMPDFDAEILQRDFSINEVEQDAVVDSVYDTA